MPIPYATIKSDILASLDAEGSTYYDDNLDILPAINKGQDYLMSIILPRLGSKKFNEEIFKGIITNRIFQPNIYSRILVDDTISTWGIITVLVNPVVAKPPAAVTPFVPIAKPANESAYVGTYIFASGGSACRRLNSQEFNSNKGNPFEAGYISQNPNAQNVSYAYSLHTDYQSQIDANMPYEISISPPITIQTPVAITFAKYPTHLLTITDSSPFSIIFKMLLVKASLKFIAEAQGDKTTIYEISETDLIQVTGLMS